MFKNIMYLLFLLLLNIQCGKSQESIEKCKEAFTKATQQINSYQIDKDKNRLEKALDYLEVSVACEKTKLTSIELKISILNTLDAYEKNILFIESLKIEDFDKPYKKDMYLNFVKSKHCQDKINCREKYLREILSSIDNYIKEVRFFDESVYYDLFTIKAEILSEKELSEDIQNIIKQYPEQREFLETLEFTLIEKEQISVSE